MVRFFKHPLLVAAVLPAATASALVGLLRAHQSAGERADAAGLVHCCLPLRHIVGGRRRWSNAGEIPRSPLAPPGCLPWPREAFIVGHGTQFQGTAPRLEGSSDATSIAQAVLAFPAVAKIV